MRIVKRDGGTIPYEGDLTEDSESIKWFDPPKTPTVQNALVMVGEDKFMVLERDKPLRN